MSERPDLLRRSVAEAIGAFALVRTMGLVPDIAKLLDPCSGAITWTGADARREP